MDSMSFATIVSLLASYSSIRSSRKSTDTDDFLQWLISEGHQDIYDRLRVMDTTLISIKVLLGLQQKELIDRLDMLDKHLAASASLIPEFSRLVEIIRPEASLSEQAISIIEQMEDGNISSFSYRKDHEGDVYINPIDGEGYINLQENRFIDDDLDTLVKNNFLLINFGSHHKKYTITRKASDFIKRIKKGA